MKLGICKECNKEKLIYAKGLCKYHYNKSITNPIKQKEYNTKWRNNNRKYWKEYYLIKRQEKIEDENKQS